MKDFFSKLPKLPKLNLPFKHKQPGGKTPLNQTQLLALAGAFCFLLACVTYFLLPSGEDTAKKQEVPMTQVVVAKQDIPQRTVIKENMLKVVDMPQDAVPDGAMRSVSEAVDKPANVPIQQGDILTDKKVITDPKLAGFVGMIPPDCRAISVGISDITGIAGFAKPGDYVDVMIIRKNKGQGNVSGEILLQNVLLLGLNKTAASNGEMQKSGGDSKDKDAKDKDKKNGGGSDANASKDAMATATLALTSEEALKLAVEAQTGTIYLGLRPVTPSDVFAIDTEYTTVDSDTAEKTNAAPAALAPAAPAPSASSSYHSSPAPSYSSPAPAAPASVPAVQAPSVDDGIEVIRGVESKMEGGN